MKKIIALALVLTMVLSLTAVVASAHKNNTSYGTVPVTKEAIKVDGVKDAAYGSALKVEVADSLSAVYNPAAPASIATGEAYMLVSSDYTTLYIFAEIYDEDIVYDPVTDPTATESNKAVCSYMHDGFEVFIDPTNSATVTMGVNEYGYPVANPQQTHQLYQYRMEVNGTKTSGIGRDNASGTVLNAAFEAETEMTSAETYTIEMAIDLKTISQYSKQQICKADAQIGLLFMINDKISTSELCNNITSTCLEPFSPDANSPSVWAAQDWDYIALGQGGKNTTVEDDPNKDPYNTPTHPVDHSSKSDDADDNGESAGDNGETAKDNAPEKEANKTADTVAVAAGILVLAAASAVVVSKKRR